MSTGMPELGSKISLISKADIRYEGRLFTVDPKECTIALASVRSFGTEDRDTPYPVPAQNQVYDYILFRGSDIKDIRVVNNVAQPLNDPAIMQLSVPPSLGQQPFQPHPMLGHLSQPPPMGGQFPSSSAAYSNMAGLSGGLLPPGGLVGGGGGVGGLSRDPRGGGPSLSMANAAAPPTQKDLILSGQSKVLSPSNEPQPIEHDLIGGGTRSLTPASLGSRKSPTNEQGTQAGGQKRGDDKKQMKPIQPPRNQQYQPKSRSQERRNSRGNEQNAHHHQQQQQHQQHHQQQQQHHQQQNDGGYHQRNNRQSMNRNNYQPHPHQQHQQQQQHMQGQRNWGQNSANMSRGPMRPRGRPRGGFKPVQGQLTPGGNNKPKNTLKFENDYDFETANTEFEGLKSQLAKVKIDDGAPPAAGGEEAEGAAGGPAAVAGAVAASGESVKTEVTTNGDVDKKDDSGNETGAGENEQEEENEVFYDKAKSFFDKISCEAVERAKGKSQRTDWRTERKLNSETFGVAATRRGNFRGRGGFRGMGYRGGNNYRGGYNRPQQQRRDNIGQPRSNNQELQQQQAVPATGAV